MKANAKSIFITVVEWIILIAPTTGYAIYTYADTLQYTMTAQSKGCFWALIAIAALAAVLYGIFKKRYDRYVQGYVQQKTDLETNPTNDLLIKKVAEKQTVIENLDYVVALIPVLISVTVLYAFQQAIEQLVILLLVIAGSLIAKIALHSVAIYIKKVSAINANKDTGGDDK